ncbi:hypothetical protein [Pareuzebyella sediminis]|uniref:hypothetical protein n=1 Tax=Pareuzebyella sediminis TaxID=2607998 RepID=UPI0011F063B3|nr:hypothetical protein [Pareuzebyella sediminis]
MRNIYLAILLVFSFLAIGFSQEAKKSKAELRSVFEPTDSESIYTELLCKRWEFKYAFVGQTKMPKLPGNKYFDIWFRPNGSYELIGKENRIERGEWNYNQDKRLFQLTSKQDDFKAIIKSIGEDELTITMLTDNNEAMKPNRQIHFRAFKY